MVAEQFLYSDYAIETETCLEMIDLIRFPPSETRFHKSGYPIEEAYIFKGMKSVRYVG